MNFDLEKAEEKVNFFDALKYTFSFNTEKTFSNKVTLLLNILKFIIGGAGIYIGLKRDSSREEIEQKVKDGSILELLNFVKVKPGDTFIINPGTIHAIGRGVRLIEIQQNSNLTYRLFDYNRVDKN